MSQRPSRNSKSWTGHLFEAKPFQSVSFSADSTSLPLSKTSTRNSPLDTTSVWCWLIMTDEDTSSRVRLLWYNSFLVFCFFKLISSSTVIPPMLLFQEQKSHSSRQCSSVLSI